MKLLFTIGIAISGLATATPAHSTALLTSVSQYTGNAFVISDAYKTGDTGMNNYFNGQIDLGGGVSVTTSFTTIFDGGQSTIGDAGYGLGENQSANSLLVGSNDGAATLTFRFDAPVSSYGFQVNYAVVGGAPLGNDPTISAYDINGGLIASYNIEALAPIRTPNVDDPFQFRGIESTGAAIAELQISGAYIAAQSYAATSVPEPATWALMLAGLGATTLSVRHGRLRYKA